MRPHSRKSWYHDPHTVGHGTGCEEKPSRKSLHYHSLSVSYGIIHSDSWATSTIVGYCCTITHLLLLWDTMRWDETACLKMSVTYILLVIVWNSPAEDHFTVTHNLLVMIWDQIRLPDGTSCVTHFLLVMEWDETAWLKVTALSLTPWCLWDEVRWHFLVDNASATHTLLVMGWDLIRLPGLGCHSLAGNEIWWDSLAENHGSVTHILLVMGWDMMGLPGRKSLSLTRCQMAWDKLWHKSHCTVAHILCMGYDVMRLPGKKSLHCHSQSVGHGIWCDETSWQKVSAVPLTHCWSRNETAWKMTTLPLTFCWSWHEIRWDCLKQKIMALSLTSYWPWYEIWWYRKSYYDVAHALLVTALDILSQLGMKYHCTVTHTLLVIVWDETPLKKITQSLTPWKSRMMWWDW